MLTAYGLSIFNPIVEIYATNGEIIHSSMAEKLYDMMKSGKPNNKFIIKLLKIKKKFLFYSYFFRRHKFVDIISFIFHRSHVSQYFGCLWCFNG